MRRIVASTIALVLALAASALALAATGRDKGSDKRHTQTVQLTASSFDSRDLDLGQPALSLGDASVVTEDLFRKGAKVGSDHAICTITRKEPKTGTPTTGAVTCAATLLLPHGQITLHGTHAFAVDARKPPNFVLAVTGGTGAYKTARGTAHIVDLNETNSRLTITLLR